MSHIQNAKGEDTNKILQLYVPSQNALFKFCSYYYDE